MIAPCLLSQKKMPPSERAGGRLCIISRLTYPGSLLVYFASGKSGRRTRNVVPWPGVLVTVISA
ncbi:hypothetical protein PAECIP111802_03018 [Paenibacillus allorhizosphaerae]|uniref:Uncharacterized protein n=1 Tax=Paenibacillus allorhizosphaerae TaxID=2849866 RepID=A0ABM8VI29_9BACL|nr:hypothetical protein PAECIP111802_03018 [Paenibacillus allorhizosphaerae]